LASVAVWSDSLIGSLLSGQPGEIARSIEKALASGVRELKEWLLNHAIDSVVEETFARPGQASPWACRRCGPRCGRQLRRNGSYKRSPLTLDGPIRLRIPQLLCRDCNQAVPFELPCLNRYSRVWLDLRHKVVKEYMLGHSYRSVAANAAQGIGLMTAWRCLQHAAEGHHAVPPAPELVAIGLDEVHNRVQGEPMWLLTARGLGKDGAGYYLGSVLSSDRSREAWETALDGLGVRGWPDVAIMADGDQAIESAVGQCLPGKKVQRCAWHLLHNASDWVQGRYPGKANEGLRRGLLAGAQAVVNAATTETRRQSLLLLTEANPWFGHKLGRSLWRVGYPDQDTPRTNNVCERGFREWRRRTRSMDGFGSRRGIKNFMTLWMLKENARSLKLNWMEALMP
jgi:transposase-like protein